VICCRCGGGDEYCIDMMTDIEVNAYFVCH